MSIIIVTYIDFKNHIRLDVDINEIDFIELFLQAILYCTFLRAEPVNKVCESQRYWHKTHET